MQTGKRIFKTFLIFLTTAIFAVVFSFNNVFASASEFSFTIIAGEKTYSLSGEEIGFYKGKKYIKCLEGVVDGVFYDTAVFPKNASLTFTHEKENPFNYQSEVYGRGINKEKLIEDINLALCNGENKAFATFIELVPETLLKDLKKHTYKTATFSTFYGNSSSGRKHNIYLACQKINGTVLASGEEFSFNKIVGDRTENNGFKSATVIENGEYLEGVGGGVCQVSTTLYNCALLSGLKVTKRHAHSIQPIYVEPSFDAMVSGSAFDLKFVNDTSGNVYIKAVADGSFITFTIYGEKLTKSYERVSSELEVIKAPEIKVIEDDSLELGKEEWIKFSKDGLKSEGYLKVTDANGKVQLIKLHTDVYKSVQGVMKVGTKAVDKAENIV